MHNTYIERAPNVWDHIENLAKSSKSILTWSLKNKLNILEK